MAYVSFMNLWVIGILRSRQDVQSTPLLLPIKFLLDYLSCSPSHLKFVMHFPFVNNDLHDLFWVCMRLRIYGHLNCKIENFIQPMPRNYHHFMSDY